MGRDRALKRTVQRQRRTLSDHRRFHPQLSILHPLPSASLHSTHQEEPLTQDHEITPLKHAAHICHDALDLGGDERCLGLLGREGAQNGDLAVWVGGAEGFLDAVFV